MTASNALIHPPNEGRTPLTITLGFQILVVLALLSLIWLWRLGYAALLYDDSFYYPKTAINFAQVYGPTFDRINLTNGFHPLWLLFLSLLSIVTASDIVLLSRLSLTVQILMIATAIILAERKRLIDRRNGWVLVLFLGNSYTVRILLNGLESALLFLLLTGTTARLYAHKPNLNPSRISLMAGVLGGLTTLARLEAALFAVPLIILSTLSISAEEQDGLAVNGWQLLEKYRGYSPSSPCHMLRGTT